MSAHLSPEEVRARIDHPVIDADGHWLEYGPVVLDALERIGGKLAVQGFRLNPDRVSRALSLDVGGRRREHIAQEAFWGAPTRNTRDRATAMMPKLFHHRLEELGYDFAVTYPTAGLSLPRIPDPAMRRATIRAFNIFTAEHFAPYADRLTPAAVIPMHSPEEALEEIAFVTGELGLKVVMMGSLIRRPIPQVREDHPGFAERFPWLDVLGLDSAHDYDPVWAECVARGLAPTFHTGSRGLGLRVSPSNFVFNHIGHFAQASEAVCKALFLGGVTRRFPTLKVGFLEGGVGWACQLYADLIGHWEKRSLEGLEDVRPENLDRALLLELAGEYGSEAMVRALRGSNEPADLASGGGKTGGIANLDDYSACEIDGASDFEDLFVRPFYFGCEADDPMNATAFDRKLNPGGVRLNALFGSDVGHFDVPDMSEVLGEAYELVDEDKIDAGDFRDFVFANAVRFWGEANPSFFEGTAVEREAAAVLAGASG
jgi:hypothetical protein